VAEPRGTFEELLERSRAEYAAWTHPDIPRIDLAWDTSSLAAGCEQTQRALARAIEERGAAVEVGRTVGYGLQWLQPLAHITWPDGTTVLYGPVTAESVGMLVDEATGFLRRAGVAEPAVVCRLDMRYQGQGYEIEVTVPGDGTRGGYAAAFSRLETLFRAQYAEIFAETFLDEPLEIVSWKVEAAGSEAPLAYHGMRGGERGRAKRSRALWFGDAFVDCEVIDRYGLAVGTTVEGPAVVEERESTCVLAPGDRATVDERLNLVAELANRGGDA